jgi:hypothetical protein
MTRHASLRRVLVLILAASVLAGMAASHGAPHAEPPPFPANVRASDGAFSWGIRVSWNPSPGASTYRVFRANSLDGNKTSLANVAANTYDDYSAWAALTVHWYWVIACTEGGSCSGQGNAYGTPDFGFRGLAVPDVSASDGTRTDGVSIVWTASQGADSYTLYRGSSDQGYSTSLQGLTGTSYLDTNALRGVLYFYWVKAVAVEDDSAMGGPDSGFRNFEPPAGVSASDGTYADKVRVTWLGSPSASRYQVWSELAAVGAANKLGAQPAPPLDDFGGGTGVLYRYHVRACNDSETICSSPSAKDEGYRGALASPTSTRTPTVQATMTPTSTAPPPTATATRTRAPGRDLYLPLIGR